MSNDLAGLRGGRVEDVRILRWARPPKGTQEGSVALGFVLSTGRLLVFNAMDENGIQAGEWGPDWAPCGRPECRSR
jgi:hypothetical protein